MINVVPFRTPRQRRRIGLCVNEVTGRYRVYVFPPCRHGGLDQEFTTTGDAVTYAARLAAAHGFPVHTPGIPDRDWELLVQETLGAL